MRLKLKNTDEIRTTRVKSFLYDYFKNGMPATFYQDGRIQCGKGKARTFGDLVAIVDHYFKTISKEKVAYILMELILENKGEPYDPNNFSIGAVNCNDVGGITFNTEYWKYHPYAENLDNGWNRYKECDNLNFDQIEQLAINYGKDLLQKKAK